MLSTHDHRGCILAAVAIAQELCHRRNQRLTPLREEVLTSLWQSHCARGAYDILEDLNAHDVDTKKRKLAPLSVYRALEFLVEQGLAHRVESLNAYIGCPHPHEHHALQFLVCEKCKLVTEISDQTISRALSSAARSHNFTLHKSVVEVVGLCDNCTNSELHAQAVQRR